MTEDQPCAPSDRRHDVDAPDTEPLPRRPRADFADVLRVASDDVDQLVEQLERTLDPAQRRLLHRIRLAAESLGGVRAASLIRGGP
jgi:hypothetical protein